MYLPNGLIISTFCNKACKQILNYLCQSWNEFCVPKRLVVSHISIKTSHINYQTLKLVEASKCVRYYIRAKMVKCRNAQKCHYIKICYLEKLSEWQTWCTKTQLNYASTELCIAQWLYLANQNIKSWSSKFLELQNLIAGWLRCVIEVCLYSRCGYSPGVNQLLIINQGHTTQSGSTPSPPLTYLYFIVRQTTLSLLSGSSETFHAFRTENLLKEQKNSRWLRWCLQETNQSTLPGCLAYIMSIQLFLGT